MRRFSLDKLNRKSALIIVVLCFVAMVTGLTLELHLLNHKHSDNHIPSRCRICHQLLSTIDKINITTEPIIEKVNGKEYSPDFICQITPSFSNIRLPIPRSPPFTL